MIRILKWNQEGNEGTFERNKNLKITKENIPHINKNDGRWKNVEMKTTKKYYISVKFCCCCARILAHHDHQHLCLFGPEKMCGGWMDGVCFSSIRLCSCLSFFLPCSLRKRSSLNSFLAFLRFGFSHRHFLPCTTIVCVTDDAS